MRHGNKLNHLGRKSAHRKAMISNMACSLIQHKRISTTLAKAKALRVFVEPILTKSKSDSTHSRRVVFSYLQNKEIVTELFREVAPKIADRSGGYTRIIRTGYRLGDNAEMCMIELVDFNEVYNTDRVKKTTRRSRRGGSTKPTASIETMNDEAAPIEEAVVVEDLAVSEESAPIEEAPINEEVAVVEEAPAQEESPAVVEDTVAEEVSETEEMASNEEEPAASEEAPAVAEENEEEASASNDSEAEGTETSDDTPKEA